MGIIRLEGVKDFQSLLRRRWRQPLITLLSRDWEHTMCSGRLNDRNGLVGTYGSQPAPAELSAPARLKVTTEGQARGSPCCQAEDVQPGRAEGFILCTFPSQNTFAASLQGKAGVVPGRREQARGWHGSEPTDAEDESIQLTSPCPGGRPKPRVRPALGRGG